MTGEALLKWTTRIGVGILASGLIATRCFFTVDGGECGIIFDRFKGVKPKIYKEGWHLFIPMVQTPKIFEIRSTPQVIHSTTGTRDMQTAIVSLRLLFRPEAEFLPTIYLNLGQDFKDRVLPSIGNEVLKAVIAQYNADQLLTQREKVSSEIKEILINRAKEFHIHLDDVAIIHLQFGKEFTQAIEGKQVAQQNAEK